MHNWIKYLIQIPLKANIIYNSRKPCKVIKPKKIISTKPAYLLHKESCLLIWNNFGYHAAKPLSPLCTPTSCCKTLKTTVQFDIMLQNPWNHRPLLHHAAKPFEQLCSATACCQRLRTTVQLWNNLPNPWTRFAILYHAGTTVPQCSYILLLLPTWLSLVRVLFSLTPKGQSMCRMSLFSVNMNTINTNSALNTAKKNTDLSLNSFSPDVILACQKKIIISLKK